MRSTVTFFALAASALPFTAAAQSAPDVADLVGARGAGGETQLLARGYESRGGNVVRDTRYTFWWNARTGRCISVATADGRYSAITAVPAENCQSGGRADAYTPPADHDVQRSEPGYRDANSLVLVCYGAGTRPTVTNRPSYNWNPRKHKWEWSNQLGNSAEGFNSDIQIELYGDHGRIHLGPKLVSPIHSGGDNGWWDIDNLVVTPDRITGSYRLNGMNKPKLTVDRRSGRITIQAVTNFSGQCDMGDWGAGQRRF
ncbi:hypothetical protein [Sphingopyxis witflariensis]|uniref:Ricin B lectin domain-containing protein n=1 Tax=Sphingopyxis witflariensis TaxID=173675 RepID=A0A246JU97_9SPHN|nr:hypothetical protein [Sphingopyxis witflariensis]OWQ96410.1 hypothetical protein CDQ91_13040 [Sphingopyxis witflariensis]